MIDVTIKAKQEVIDQILDFIDTNGLVALVMFK